MSEERAIDVLGRFAHLGRKVGPRLALPPNQMRRLIATSTESQLAVYKMYVVRDATTAVLEERPVIPPDLTSATSWSAVVFRANGAAIAELDRIVSMREQEQLVIDLIGRAGFYQGRSSLPPSQLATDELQWRVTSLDASLSNGQAMGAGLSPGDLDALAALREELSRRER